MSDAGEADTPGVGRHRVSADHTIMVVAFKGWNDAADAASDAVAQVREAVGAEPVHAIDPEPYHDFQVTRPEMVAVPGGGRRLVWPSTQVRAATIDGRRLLIVEGTEPSMRWRGFCAELLGFAAEHDVDLVVTVGALLTDVPHTRPIPVSATSEDPATAGALSLEPSGYEGPTGIVGVLQHEARAADIAGVSVWAAVPHYVAQPPNPKAVLALLRKLEDLLGLPLGDPTLVEEAEAWQRGVDELAEEDSEVAEYVRQLEEAKDTAELPEASGEAIAKEFERYLRRRGDDRG